MKYKSIYFLFSAFFILPSIYFLIRFGLQPAIDFTGGTLIEFSLENSETISSDQLQSAINDQISIFNLSLTDQNTFVLKTSPLDQDTKQQLYQNLQNQFGPLDEKRLETIGPALGKELIKKTFIGLVLAAGFILLYVTTRFKDKSYGICAILAMLHDTLILLGVFSFLGVYQGVEVDALFVTAVLTILSFSVHDTIVVYDRIRETLKLESKKDFTFVVNKAVTETLARSINNSLTIIFMLLSLYLFGGQTTKWFILALLIGTISGTYSSTFTAAPLLVLLKSHSLKSHSRSVKPVK